MQNEDFKKTLEQLRQEVNDLGPDAAGVKRHLDSLIGDLELQVDTPADGERRASLRGRAASMIERFEADHSSLTLLLNRVIAFLGDVGV